MTRYEANMQILLRLNNYLEINKDVRFCQALHNLGINEFDKEKLKNLEIELKDKYNEESTVTLLKLKQ